MLGLCCLLRIQLTSTQPSRFSLYITYSKVTSWPILIMPILLVFSQKNDTFPSWRSHQNFHIYIYMQIYRFNPNLPRRATSSRKAGLPHHIAVNQHFAWHTNELNKRFSNVTSDLFIWWQISQKLLNMCRAVSPTDSKGGSPGLLWHKTAHFMSLGDHM